MSNPAVEVKDLVKVFPFPKKSFFKKKNEESEKIRENAAKAGIPPTYEGYLILRKLNLVVEQGEFVVIKGDSGCGKTTLLRIIAGLDDVSAGEVFIDGEDVTDYNPEDRSISMVFQNYSLYPHLSVFDNIAFPLQTLHIPRDEIAESVNDMIKLLGLTGFENNTPSELSGGQCQRVAIGRALIRKPKVFLLDEPFSNLDPQLRTTLRAELVRLNKELGAAFIYVTHNLEDVESLNCRILTLKDGVLI